MSNFDKLQGREGSQNAVWYGGRYLDPVRKAALHEAVQLVSAPEYLPLPPLDTDRLDHVLQIAEQFERWLTGTDEDPT